MLRPTKSCKLKPRHGGSAAASRKASNRRDLQAVLRDRSLGRRSSVRRQTRTEPGVRRSRARCAPPPRRRSTWPVCPHDKQRELLALHATQSGPMGREAAPVGCRSPGAAHCARRFSSDFYRVGRKFCDRRLCQHAAGRIDTAKTFTQVRHCPDLQSRAAEEPSTAEYLQRRRALHARPWHVARMLNENESPVSAAHPLRDHQDGNMRGGNGASSATNARPGDDKVLCMDRVRRGVEAGSHQGRRVPISARKSVRCRRGSHHAGRQRAGRLRLSSTPCRTTTSSEAEAAAACVSRPATSAEATSRLLKEKLADGALRTPCGGCARSEPRHRPTPQDVASGSGARRCTIPRIAGQPMNLAEVLDRVHARRQRMTITTSCTSEPLNDERISARGIDDSEVPRHFVDVRATAVKLLPRLKPEFGTAGVKILNNP